MWTYILFLFLYFHCSDCFVSSFKTIIRLSVGKSTKLHFNIKTNSNQIQLELRLTKEITWNYLANLRLNPKPFAYWTEFIVGFFFLSAKYAKLIFRVSVVHHNFCCLPKNRREKRRGQEMSAKWREGYEKKKDCERDRLEIPWHMQIYTQIEEQQIIILFTYFCLCKYNPTEDAQLKILFICGSSLVFFVSLKCTD